MNKFLSSGFLAFCLYGVALSIAYGYKFLILPLVYGIFYWFVAHRKSIAILFCKIFSLLNMLAFSLLIFLHYWVKFEKTPTSSESYTFYEIADEKYIVFTLVIPLILLMHIQFYLFFRVNKKPWQSS